MNTVSSPDLDRQMKESFQVRKGPSDRGPGPRPTGLASHRNTGIPGPAMPLLRDGLIISYRNLPANVALRAKFRDAGGDESVSAHFGFPRKAGEWGTIWMLD